MLSLIKLTGQTLKKIDFHIHTMQKISDAAFRFSLGKLEEYVISAWLHAIAITNHKNCLLTPISRALRLKTKFT